MIRPIVSALLRHKVSTGLIVCEIAICCAIVCNVLFLISARVERLGRGSGLQEDRLVRIEMGAAGDRDAAVLTSEDLAALRSISGVESATVANQVPYVKSSWNSPVNLAQVQEDPTLSAATYLADESFLRTFGVRMAEGRGFESGEYIDWSKLNDESADVSLPAALVTRAVAARLFPGESAVGKTIYTWGDRPVRVVGVIAELMVPDDNGQGDASNYSIVLPVRAPFDLGAYLIRTSDPTRRAEVLAAAAAALKRNAADRVLVSKSSIQDMRRDFYSEDRSMALLLGISCVLLLLITALGLIGLSSFWVEQRTRQIGIRRALGATRRQILAYFQIENFLLVGAGIFIGMLLAYAVNLLLMSRYELPRLPALYLPLGAATLWLLGQIAVFWPAMKASVIAPASATRSL